VSRPRFESVADPRKARGKRHSLRSILSAVHVGMLCMLTSTRHLEEFIKHRTSLMRRLGVVRNISDTTINEMLAVVDWMQLRLQLHAMVLAEWRRKALECIDGWLPIRVLSVDGKCDRVVPEKANEFCQRQSAEGSAPYWLYRELRAALIHSAAKVFVDFMPIPAKTNEKGAFPDFFRGLLSVYGNLFEVVRADSGFASKHNAALVHGANKGYIFQIKSDLGAIYDEALRLLRPKAGVERPEAESPWVSGEKGCKFRRRFWRVLASDGYLPWAGCQQAWLVVNETKKPDAPVKVEERLFLTNLPWNRLKPAHCLRAVTAHWAIEENYKTLDVYWREDHAKFAYSGNALPVLSAIRLMAINTYHLLRTRYLRSKANRRLTWRMLCDLVRDVVRSCADLAVPRWLLDEAEGK
jgi:hypothetical protein